MPAYDGIISEERSLATGTMLRRTPNYESDTDDSAKLIPKTCERPYPKCVFFILGNEFCERYSYYGMRTILVLYLKYYLEMSDDTSTAVYHAFTVLAYLFPLMGAFIADSWLGKYKTILYLSIVYAIGMILNTLGAVWTLGDMTLHTTLSMIGLFVIAVGTGGIKPCVSSFGGDQFHPDQEEYRRSFFSLFYFAINAGSLISTIVSPIIRDDVKCFDRDDCYALAFGIPAVLMVIAIIAFVAGTRYYIIKPPEGNVFAEVFRGMGSAIKHRWNTPRKERNKEHWMDYALVDTSPKMVRDTKYVLRVLLLYVPLPLFWALFDQQGSRWTLQATRMDGYVGAIQVKPDQMQVFNPLLIVTLIPLFEATLYPCLRHFNLNFTPLRKMTLGMILAGVSFCAAAVVQLQMDETLTKIPDEGSEASFRIINGADCTVEIHTDVYDDWAKGLLIAPGETTDSLEEFIDKDKIDKTFSVEYHCPGVGTERPSQEVTLYGEATWNMVISKDGDDTLKSQVFEGIVEKSESGGATVRIFNALNQKISVEYISEDGKHRDNQNVTLNDISGEWDIDKDNYTLVITTFDDDEKANSTIYFDTGGDYTVLVWRNGVEIEITSYTDVYPNVVNIFWMIPQYFIITLGEVFLSVTGLEFSYSQAPTSMKSVLASFWLLTVSLGNIIVLIIAEAKFVPNQADEYFLFAGLIGIAAIVFIFLAIRYDYVDESEFYETEDDPLDGGTNYAEHKNDGDDSSISSAGSTKKKKESGTLNTNFEPDYATAF